MTAHRDLERAVRGWMEEGVTILPDRVLDAVLDEVPRTRQRRRLWPGPELTILRSAPMRVGIAAAVVVAAIFSAGLLVGREIGAPEPTPEPTPRAAGAFPEAGQIAGTYRMHDDFPVRLTMKVPEGWWMWSPGGVRDGVGIYKHSPDPQIGLGIVISSIANLYADPCLPTEGFLNPPLGPTVRDLADALASQAGTVASDPVPITLAGYQGLYLEYRFEGAPGCTDIDRWPTSVGPREALRTERDEVWILDVDGERIVIDLFSFDRTAEEDLVQARQIVQSIRIAPKVPIAPAETTAPTP